MAKVAAIIFPDPNIPAPGGHVAAVVMADPAVDPWPEGAINFVAAPEDGSVWEGCTWTPQGGFVCPALPEQNTDPNNVEF